MTLLKYFSIATVLTSVFTVKAQTASSDIDINSVINPNAKLLLGISMDSRCGMMGTAGPVGYFDAAGNLISNIDTLFDDFPLNGVRYPANGMMFGFDWKKSIGPFPRPNQNILGSMGSAQSVDFGFDEFMSWVESKGLTGEDVQIMVSFYDSATTYNPTQNLQRLPYVASHAADWVEYANAPQGVNWGGGIEWSAQRVSNGHPEPYNIRIWNIGNEPWGPMEMNFDSSLYIPLAGPVIDSMLARDPSIHITLPAIPQANSDWNYMIRKYAVSHGGIYGISPHAFQTMQSVYNVEQMWKTLIDSSNNANLKVIAGDFSFSIPSLPPTTADKNRAMSWEGVLYSTDMLLMFSQYEIERANHWVFGLNNSVWRPIRKESSGSYTMLPVGTIYEILTPYFSGQSVLTTTSSPNAADGVPYSLRASAFRNAPGDTIQIVAVNRDTVSNLLYTINGLGSCQIFQALLLTSDSLTGETIYSNPIYPDANGDFDLPPMSILLLKATSNILSTQKFVLNNDLTLYPNPATDQIKILVDHPIEKGQLLIINSVGQIVYSEQNLTGNYFEFQLDLSQGIYEVVVEDSNGRISKKLIFN